jgi:FkbM family methyltransferase
MALKEYWRVTEWPTLEITTSIPKAGCIVDCVFCPQRVLQKVWNSEHFTTEKERTLTLDNFKMVIDKLPKEVRITLSGFTEPWLNKRATDMLLYAHSKGHPVSVFTTAVGMSLKDVERIKDIPFCGGPNGGFTLHLPDKEYKAKHPVNKKYIQVCEALKKANIQNFATMAMGTVHPEVEHLYPDEEVNKYEMWHRAGNLLGEAQLKPEVKEVWNEFKSILHEKPKTCGCIEDLYHNILLPNGEVSLCCMDYNLEEIIGNLFTQEYDDILPKPNTTFDMCMRCENGINPKNLTTVRIAEEDKITSFDPDNFLLPESMVQYLDVSTKPFLVPESEVIQWCKKFTNKDKDFVDIGAHIGTYTWNLAPDFKHTHSFEPTKVTYNFLCSNILIKGLSDKVDAYNTALSESQKVMTFYERSPDGGTNGLDLDFYDGKWTGNNQDSYNVEVNTLDDYKLRNVGFIKIDVEGYELPVLQGAIQTIQNNGYPPILFESWPSNNKTNTKLKHNLFNYLFALGYTIGSTPHPEIYIAIKELH